MEEKKTASGILNRHQRNVCTQQYLSACVNVLFRGNDRKKERERERAGSGCTCKWSLQLSNPLPCWGRERGERGDAAAANIAEMEEKCYGKPKSNVFFSQRPPSSPHSSPVESHKKQKAAEEEIPLITLERHDEVQEANVLDTLFLLKERGKDLMARRHVLFQLNGRLSFRLWLINSSWRSGWFERELVWFNIQLCFNSDYRWDSLHVIAFKSQNNLLGVNQTLS